jgi:hypothetical protein
MKLVPKEVPDLLDEVAARLPAILGGNLVGIYLYGSLTQDAFDVERSDVDCIVVTRRDLSDEEFANVDDWLDRVAAVNPWTEKLQMSFLLRDELLVMDSKACHYQFGRLSRGGSDGNPIFWINILDSGLTLYGPRPSEFVPEITRAILHEALLRETNYLREEIDNPESEWRDIPKYRGYAVLTLCRILYSHEFGTIASKPAAAEWVVPQLPSELREAVDRALTGENIRLERIREFIGLTSERLAQ